MSVVTKIGDGLSLQDVSFWQVMTYLVMATYNAPWFWFIIVAMIGGLAALTNMDADPANKFSFADGVRKISNRMVVSVFIGLMIWYAAEGMGYSASPWSRLAAGLGGYGGVKTIELGIEIATDFINKWRAGKGGS